MLSVPIALTTWTACGLAMMQWLNLPADMDLAQRVTHKFSNRHCFDPMRMRLILVMYHTIFMYIQDGPLIRGTACGIHRDEIHTFANLTSGENSARRDSCARSPGDGPWRALNAGDAGCHGTLAGRDT